MPNEAFDTEHHQAWAIIPWHVNGTATAAEREQLLAHLARCPDCSTELLNQMQIHEAMQSTRPQALNPEQGFARLLERLDRESDRGLDREWDRAQDAAAAQAPPPAPPSRSSSGSPADGVRATGTLVRRLGTAVIAEAAALVALSLALVLHRPGTAGPETALPMTAADYHTRTAASALPATAQFRVVFAPQLSLQQLDSILQHAQLQIVSGPNSLGAFALAPESATVNSAQTLAQLRANAAVLLAEPLLASP